MTIRKFIGVLFFTTVMAGLFGQECANTGTMKVNYYKNDKNSLNKLDNYFVPVCDSILTIDIKAANLHYRDPVANTAPGYRFMILKKLPKHDTISATRLKEWILLSDDGHPIFILPTNTISLSEIGRHIGFLESVYVVPVMLDNAVTNDIDSLFENDCVKLFTAESLKIYYPRYKLDYREDIEIGMIQFPGWPEELVITDFIDIKVTDELGQKINYSVYDNNTIWLDLQRKDAFYDFNLFVKESPDCPTKHIGNYPYPLPVVQIQIDSAYGKKGEEVCLPVTSRYFKSVTDFNLRFYWAKDSLQFNGISNMHPQLYRIVQTRLFEVQESYQELSINPKRDWQDTISIQDGEVLFEMCFTPLVEGTGEIPVRVRKQPYTTGDSLSFEIVGVPVDTRANTGIINLLDEKGFYYDIAPLCTSGDAGLYDFKLTIMGDNGPYTYSFNDPAVRDSTFTDSVITIRDVPEGGYTFTVINRYDQIVATDLKVYPGINKGNFELSIDSSQIIQPDCTDSLGGKVILQVSPPDGTYNYHWIEGGKDYPDSVISGLPAGMHTFRVTDENQCANTISYEMKRTHMLSVTWDEEQLKICPYQDSATVDLQVSAADYQAQIDRGDTLQKPVMLKLSVGDYDLSIWAAGCRLDTNLTVVRDMPFMITPPLPPEINVLENDSIELDINLSPSASSTTWIFDQEVIGDQTALTWTPDRSGYLHLRAQYPPGCLYLDSVFIDVVPEKDSVFDISLPNAFSPDGDGINDEFSIPSSTTFDRVIQLNIFDRYGALVFSSTSSPNDPSNISGWDGMINGQPAPPGVYAAKALFVFPDSNHKEVIWTVHLLR